MQNHPYKSVLFLTSIDADKRAFSHVVQTADAPAFVLGLEELETHLQAVLHQPVGAHLSAAFAALITLIDPERASRRKKKTGTEKERSWPRRQDNQISRYIQQ